MTDTIHAKDHRPMSPHLQVYKPQITSIMSILHRLTGVVLMIGTVPLVLWLWGAAYNIPLYECLHNIFTAWYGKIALLGWTAAFYYHMANGVRHLIWDTGRGLDMESVNKSGAFAMVFVIVATSATWFYL